MIIIIFRGIFTLNVCTYLCQSRLGPGAYILRTSYASAPRVSRGYMFARVYVSHGYMVCARARVAWLHGLPIASPSPSPTACGRTASFNAIAFLVINPRRACAERAPKVNKTRREVLYLCQRSSHISASVPAIVFYVRRYMTWINWWSWV